jgi:hypothetical protein
MLSPAELLATTRPLSGPGRWLRVAPLAGFAAVAAVGLWSDWLGVPAHQGDVLSSLLLAGSVAAILTAPLLPWHRWPEDRQAVLPLGYFAVVLLLDHVGGIYYLAAVPIIWLALFHSRWLMLAGVGLFAVTLFLPRLLFPADYQLIPLAELALVFALISVAGLAMQGLVEHVRAVAAASAAAARQAGTDRDLLTAYLDNAGALVVVQDPDGRMLLLNRFAEQILGLRTDELAGQVPWGRSESAARSRPVFERVIAGESPVRFENDVADRSQDLRRVAWTVTGLVDETGRVSHVISVGIDITEQRAAEQRAQADRDLLTAYLDNAPCLVTVLAPDSTVLFYNRFAEKVFGIRAEDAVGQRAYDYLYADADSRESFERVLAGDWPQTHEGDMVTGTGQRRRIVWNTAALTDPAGQVTHVISTGMDITEQRAAERLSDNILAATAEQMICATDTEGRFTAFNRGGERLLGYSAEELVGVANVSVIHQPEALAVLAAEWGVSGLEEMLELAKAKLPTDRREWNLVRKDGSLVPVAMTIDPMVDQGEVVGYVAVAHDITPERAAADAMAAALERERLAAARLRELDQVKNDFVATVSHDLRTPLTSIIGNTELLLDGDAGPLGSVQRRLLDAVDRNCRRLDTLVGDLLLLSRIESGTLHVQCQPVVVREVVDGAIEALAAKLTSDVELSVDMPAGPVLVNGDPHQLERVVTNLVGNALKFTPAGGRVAVTVSAGPDQVRLQIADTGIGIPAEELPQVFDRFFRSSRSQQQESPGTGLGLTIAKSIVDLHHGVIRAAANPGGGTVITITLPRLAGAAAAGNGNGTG